MRSTRPIVVLVASVAAAFAFSAATEASAKGTNRGAGANPGGDITNAGPGGGDVPIGGFYGSTDGAPGTEGPGGIDWGHDGAEQKQIARELFTRRSRDGLRGLRDEHNRRTADPVAPAR